MSKYYIGVASREHVLNAIKLNIAQLCHGKRNPLAVMQPGDYLIYYSPTLRFGLKEPCRCFTAIGHVQAEPPYRVGDFYRRPVLYLPAREASILPLIEQLSFIHNKRSWGFPFRRGHFPIQYADFLLIADAMEASLG